MQKSFKITLLLLGLTFILFYGFLEAKVVSRLSYLIMDSNGTIESLSRLISCVFSFFSGIVLWGVISVITSVFYEVVFTVDVDKIQLYAITAIGFIILLISYFPVFSYLENISAAITNGALSIEGIKECKDYLMIKKIQAIFTILYYLYIWLTMTIVHRDEGWGVSIKYLIVIALVSFIQFFVLAKIK